MQKISTVELVMLNLFKIPYIVDYLLSYKVEEKYEETQQRITGKS